MKKQYTKKDLIMAPMPVLVIGTYDEDGVPNAMTAAWGTQCDMDKITIFLSNHKTTDNLKLKKAFTVAFATKETLVESDYFGIESGKGINKIKKAGFHTRKSEFVDAPVIDEYPVTIECEVLKLEDDDGDYRLVGKVVNVVAEEFALDENGRVDLDKLNLISYDSVTHSYRLLGGLVGRAFRDGLTIKNK
ncbi:MAG: flavin reductase family protein [Alphaproteobacteria bacterium]|nr:flavin reductase family protein [Alphaproteobacteria bacterium]